MIRTQAGLTLWATAILLLSFAMPAVGQTSKAEPDRAALAKAGRETAERIQRDSASWTMTMATSTGARFIVDVLATPSAKRLLLSVEVQGQRGELCRVVQKEGIWFVNEGKKAGKYRPFEAPLDAPTAYLYLTTSDPRFVADAESTDLGTFESVEQGVASYRTPLPESQRRQLQQVLSEWADVRRRNPAQPVDPKFEQVLKSTREVLDRGMATKVEISTGMIIQAGTPQRQIALSDFRCRPIDPKEFATDGTKWDDYTHDPTAGDRDNLVMISNNGVWRAGMKTSETDGRLLDLKTGRFRRIPFQGGTSVPGCFLKGRDRVVVTGVDPAAGGLALFEINLKTGENRKIGGELLASGISLFPVLSPDGETLAVLHSGGSGRLLGMQMCLVDLKTDVTKAIGEPHDMAFPSWLPDGRGIVILYRESAGAGRTSHWLARMDLNGAVTKLRAGSMPAVLDKKTILFLDDKTRVWQTCDLAGGDSKPYADGLTGYGFPAPSPDGKRILLMHFQPGMAPEPLVMRVGETQGKPATTAPGLWASPVWR